jgi:hypothetical protein
MPPNTNLKNLQKAIKFLNEGSNPYLTMYFVFKDGVVRQVDIDQKVQDDFAIKFKSFLNENYSSENLVAGMVSTADERRYDILEFDIDLVPPLEKLKELMESPVKEKYSHKTDKDMKLDGYVFIMGNDKTEIAFYKEHYPMDSISRDTYTIFGRDDSRFVQVPENEVYKLNNKIDFLQLNDILFVLNPKVMETNFKVHNILKTKAVHVISDINKGKVLENPEFINQFINEKPAFARKVLRVNKESPVMKLPFKDIRTFVEKHPHLKGKLKFNKRDTKFALHTKTSALLFIKLMDDDFLKSELTQRLYDSITKDAINLEKTKETKTIKKKRKK